MEWEVRGAVEEYREAFPGSLFIIRIAEATTIFFKAHNYAWGTVCLMSSVLFSLHFVNEEIED